MKLDTRLKALEARITAKFLARERHLIRRIRALNDELIRAVVNQNMTAEDRRACFFIVSPPHGNQEKTSPRNRSPSGHRLKSRASQAPPNPAHPGDGKRDPVRRLHCELAHHVHASQTKP